MRPNDICLARFPYSNTATGKLRPVLLLTAPTGQHREVLTAYITSSVPSRLLPSDVLVDPANPAHSSLNLHQPSVIRLHKLATVSYLEVKSTLGRIDAAMRADVDAKLRRLLKL